MIAVQLLVLTLAASQQTALDSLMEARRPEGSGPGMVVGAARGDLNGDGRDDTAAMFTYVIGESRNRAGAQFLVVLLDAPSAVRHVGPHRIGVKGRRLAEHVTIRRAPATPIARAPTCRTPCSGSSSPLSLW